MTNWKQIFKVLGLLLLVETGQLAVTTVVSLLYGEDITSFVIPTAITIVLGVIGMIVGRNAGNNMGRKDGYIIVSVVWVLFTLVGMLPFLISGSIPDVAGAFFESMSGFTSTGATVLDRIDSLPRGILFWRSISQWVGGIGIIFFTIAILPAFGVGEVKLFAAEATGPMRDKVHPRISVAAKWIGTVYLTLTVACIGCLILCGMNVFDAVNISMTTTATGGFAPHIAFFHEQFQSPMIEYVIAIFMLLSGMNYTLLFYSFMKGKFKRFFADSELRTYIFIVMGVTVVCTAVLTIDRYINGNVMWDWNQLELSFRESLFTIISMQTTTGFACTDYTLWPSVLLPFVMLVMFVGACSGSTSGGFKCIRISILWHVLGTEIKRILHPRAVLAVKMHGNVVSNQVQRTLLAFIFLFLVALFVGMFILSLCGLNAVDAFAVAISSISNVGPTINTYGPAHSYSDLIPLAKYTCSFLMLFGRLEIFPILIIFTRAFWKKD